MNARKKIMRKNKELTVGQKTTLRILSYIGFVICLFFIYKTSSFVIATEKTNGKVIRIDSYRSTARGKSMQYAPVFESVMCDALLKIRNEIAKEPEQE